VSQENLHRFGRCAHTQVSASPARRKHLSRLGLHAASEVQTSIKSVLVIPAKAGIVRLKAHLVREVEVLFRYALSGL
jgi:hypothetical protein